MARLILHPHSGHPREVLLNEQETVIGRLASCHVQLANDQSLSRRHARLYLDGRGWHVVDLASKNGTWVNGQQITEVRLRAGDAIRFGEVEAVFLEIDSMPIIPSYEYTPEPPPPLDGLLAPGRSALNVRTLDEDERSRDKLQLLLKASSELARLDHLEAVLDRATELLSRLFDVHRVAVFLVNPAHGRLELASLRSRSTFPGDSGPSRSAANWVHERGTAAVFADALDDQRLEASQSVHVGTIRSCMAASLVGSRGRLGVVYVDNREQADHFTEEDLRFLSGIAGQVALAVENARLYARVEDEAAARQRLLRFFPEPVARRILTSEVGLLQAVELEVTALFCDLSGYTALCNQLSAPEVLRVLNAYFRAMTEVVFREEGTLEKYIGDALMAVWGAPFPHPDDPWRAARAAVAVQRAMVGLNEELAAQGVRVRVHLGLHTGPAAAGALGGAEYLQYAAVGEATTLASRICDHAGPGEIYLSEATAARLDATLYPMERLDPLRLPGRPEPVAVWRLDWENCPEAVED